MDTDMLMDMGVAMLTMVILMDMAQVQKILRRVTFAGHLLWTIKPKKSYNKKIHFYFQEKCKSIKLFRV
jgi:hypothetical protein